MEQISGYNPMPNKDRIIVIGMILKSLRQEKKLTQKEVSDSLGINKQTYVNYEYGRNEPSIEFLIQLAYFYGVSMDVITGKTLSKPLFGDIEDLINKAYSPISENDSHEIRQIKEENQMLKNTLKMLTDLSIQVQAKAKENPELVSQIIQEELQKDNFK